MPQTIPPFLLIPVVAWGAAQVLKYVLFTLRSKNFKDYNLLYKSGGMPSAHAAVVMSVTTAVAYADGLYSATFGIAAVVAAIVLYDAVNVRRAVGEQGRALHEIAPQRKMTFFTADGHTIPEVIAGSSLGVAIAIILLQFL
jgi:hypothetical protein